MLGETEAETAAAEDEAGGEAGEACMTDEDILCQFVVWRLRQRDLPADVAAAADRLCGRFPRPGVLGGYLDAAFSVSGIPRDDDVPVTDWHRCFGRHDAIDRADQLIVDGYDYVLIQRDTRS